MERSKTSMAPVGSFFEETWHFYKEHFAPLTRIVLLPVLVSILGYTISDLHLHYSAAVGDVVLFVGWLLSIFTILPLVISIEHGTDVDDSYKAAVPLILPFAWLVVLEALAMMGGFVMLIIPGIWILNAFAVVSYVFVIEKQRGMAVLYKSKDYVEGYWWAVVLRMILMGIYVIMASAFLQLFTVMLFGEGAAAIATMALTLITTPLTTIFGYRVYQNLRSLKPELAEHHAPPAEPNGGFVMACVIVGVVALAMLLVIGVSSVWPRVG